MPTDRLFIPYIQVTRTLVYHRHNPPVGLAFPEGVEGVIRATPGSTGTEMSSDHYNNGCVEHVTDRIRFQFNVTVQTLGYLDADARMAAHGNRHLLRDSTDDEEDIQALLRGEIQVCTDFFLCRRGKCIEVDHRRPPWLRIYPHKGMVRGSSVGRAIVQRHPEQLVMLPPWEILPQLSPTPMVRCNR